MSSTDGTVPRGGGSRHRLGPRLHRREPGAVAEHPIVADVNLDRAVELWKLNQGAAGCVPGGPRSRLPIISARDTWYRYHLRLRPLWTWFGVA